jgi:hypothetical protein
MVMRGTRNQVSLKTENYEEEIESGHKQGLGEY